MSNFRELWALIVSDLARALEMLPETAESHEAVCQYREYIEHNELELACGQLERYGKENSVPREFWIALGCAATKMQLSDLAIRYEQRSSD